MLACFPYIARVYVSHVFCILQFAIYCRHYKIDLAPLRGLCLKLENRFQGLCYAIVFKSQSVGLLSQDKFTRLPNIDPHLPPHTVSECVGFVPVFS